jgi:hypothetical protein
MAETITSIDPAGRVALVDLVNRLLDRGVVVTGSVTISVADVDLLYLGLRLVLASVDRIERGPPSHDVVAIPSGPA